MPLTGQAKTDYQREYMRKRRSNKSPESVRPVTPSVRPKQPSMVRPEGLTNDQWAYVQFKAEKETQQPLMMSKPQ